MGGFELRQAGGWAVVRGRGMAFDIYALSLSSYQVLTAI